MSATVNVFPRPASLNVHTNWPLPLIDALAEMKCGLSACAAGTTANTPTSTTSEAMTSFRMETPIPPYLAWCDPSASRRGSASEATAKPLEDPSTCHGRRQGAITTVHHFG